MRGPATARRGAFRHAVTGLLLTFFAASFTVQPANAACLSSGSSALEMPAVTALRGYYADLHAPSRLAVDAADNLYITDPERGTVLVRAADGSVVARVDGLGRPTGVAVAADGTIYVGDADDGSVTAYATDWTPRFVLGSGAGEFAQPGDIAIEPQSGNVYVADVAGDSVRVYAANGAFLGLIGGSGDAEGQLLSPTGLFIDAARGELLVMDQGNYRLQLFDLEGSFIRCLGFVRVSSFSPDASFERGMGLWLDDQDRIYVVDTLVGNVKLIDRNGGLIGTLGSFGRRRGELRIPADLALDGLGRLFVSSANNGRVELFGLDDFSDPEAFVPASLSVTTPVLQRSVAAGSELTAYIELAGYRVADIETASVVLNGVPAALTEAGDRDRNAVGDLAATFDAAAVVATLPDGFAEVTVSGTVAGLAFAATETVQVVADPPEPPGEPEAPQVGSNGGCAVGAGQGDASLGVLALLALVGLGWRRRRRAC